MLLHDYEVLVILRQPLIFFEIIYNLSEDKVIWDDFSYKTGTEKTSFFLKMFFLFLKLRLIHIGGNCMKIDTQSD